MNIFDSNNKERPQERKIFYKYPMTERVCHNCDFLFPDNTINTCRLAEFIKSRGRAPSVDEAKITGMISFRPNQDCPMGYKG